MLIFLIMLLMLCLYKTKFITDKNNFQMSPLKMENVLPLRGLLALEIVLGHTYGHAPDSRLLYFNNRIGVWVVGIFFFLSGYGLMLSLHEKKNYLRGFPIKRIGSIFLPFLLMFLVNHILGFGNSLLQALIDDWFVTEVMIVYLLWYLLYKYLPEKCALSILIVLTLILNIYGCYNNIGSRWYGSTACFSVGILFEKYEDVITSRCRGNYWKAVLVNILLFLTGGFLFIISEGNTAVSAVMINFTCILLCGIVCLLFMKFTIGNRVTNFLGKISWEIYVCHRTFLHLYDKYGSVKTIGQFVYMCVLFGSIVIASWALFQVCRAMRRTGSNA